MLIILIQPNHNVGFSAINPPIGLGYIASCLKKAGHHVTILDCVLLKWSNKTLIKELVRFHRKHPIDVIGIGTISCFYLELKDLSQKIKSHPILKDIILVLGGIHVTFLPEITLRETRADFIILREGEQTIVELLDVIGGPNPNVNSVKGISYLDENGTFIQTEPRQFIKDLDNIPFPSWELMDPRLYPPQPFGIIAKSTPIAPILTTRGCPYKCVFCASKNYWGHQLRKRSPKNVVDEIECLHRSFNVMEFHIWDDNFTLDRNHSIEICKEIIRRGLKISLAAPNGVRLDQLDKKLLYYLRKAGFYSITIAVESGNQNILNLAKKDLNLLIVPEKTKELKKMGFWVMAFFILGLPGETMDTIQDTINFSMDIKTHRISYFIACPIPGSELFDMWLESQHLSFEDLKGHNWRNILFIGGKNSLCDIEYNALENIQKYAYRRFIRKHFKDFLLIVVKSFRLRQLKYRLNQIWFLLKRK